jgi:hypothetical protein
MSDAELRDAAVIALEKTTVSYPKWKERYDANYYKHPETTQWWIALNDLSQIGAPTPPPPAAITLSSNFSDGQTLAGSLAWTATAIAGSADPITRVEFYIDGALKWTEKVVPYVFNGDGNLLDTTTLTNGSHKFEIEAYTANNKATLDFQVSVNNVAPPPPPPPPATTMAQYKGGCIYTVANLTKAKDTAGIVHARSDWWLSSQSAYQSACKSLGIESLLVACYAMGMSSKGDHYPPDNYQAWATKIAQWAAANSPVAIEVWNEPWLTGFWQSGPDPQAYLALAVETAKQVWAAKPNTLIVVSMDYWMQGTGVSGKQWASQVIAADSTGFLRDPRVRPSTHNYCQTASPQTDRGTGWSFDRYKLAYDAMKAHGHPNPQVWVTEFGWDTPGGTEQYPVSETLQSQYTTDALRMMHDSGKVERAFIFQASQDDWYGIWRAGDGSSRPVCAAVKALA